MYRDANGNEWATAKEALDEFTANLPDLTGEDLHRVFQGTVYNATPEWNLDRVRSNIAGHPHLVAKFEGDNYPVPYLVTKTPYELARDNYWEVQSRFRQTSIAEIQRLIPDGIAAVILDFNDADPPRLSVDRYLADDGELIHPDEWSEQNEDEGDDSLYHRLDEIADCMEFAHWDEARSVLFRTPDADRFIIHKENQ